MIIYPAIDVRNGNCVRLFQGDFAEETCYSQNPIEVVKTYASEGATCVHVVDLEGAKQGYPVQQNLIIQMQRESHLNIQIGGGIRDKETIDLLLNEGISRVVLGSIAVNKPSIVKKWLKHYGSEKIALALDVRIDHAKDPILATQGWKRLSDKRLWDLLDSYRFHVKHVLCTDIDRDGTLKGPNIALYKTCCERYPEIYFQASGGIQSLKDLQELNRIPVAGVVIGKALYEKKFSLETAIAKTSIC